MLTHGEILAIVTKLFKSRGNVSMGWQVNPLLDVLFPLDTTETEAFFEFFIIDHKEPLVQDLGDGQATYLGVEV
jgi:hypothetical protein